jgi:hypothetical protein
VYFVTLSCKTSQKTKGEKKRKLVNLEGKKTGGKQNGKKKGKKSKTLSHLVLPIDKRNHFAKFDEKTNTFLRNKNGSGGAMYWKPGLRTFALEYLETLPTSSTRKAMKAALDAESLRERKYVKTLKQTRKEMVSQIFVYINVFVSLI